PLVVTRDTQAGATVAACNVIQGESGDNYEAGLEAMRFALLGPATQDGEPNQGFLRNDSRLVVVIFSNEDDCSEGGVLSRSNPNECVWEADSLLPLSLYAGQNDSFLSRIRAANSGSPVDFVVIAGPQDGQTYSAPEPPRPVCSANGSAFSGSRYADIVDEMGSRGSFYNICSQDYSNVLLDIAENHILPHSETICPLLTLSQAPESVRLVSGNNPNSVFILPNDNSGWIFRGASDACPTGEIEVSPARHGVLGESEQMEVTYCTTDPVPR
ncbi:MAG: hypothetical protein KC561_01570, partial [Myxococcales bacterium]|nr:hypothetical protein [Myxococcales bacterium]